MARFSLKDLADQENADQAEDGTPPPPPPAPAEHMRRQDQHPNTDTDQEPDSASPTVQPGQDQEPKWTRLERKAVLLWPDQVTHLAEVRRNLQRRKRTSGRAGRERITDATLIRVALALLLEHQEDLDGADEQELTDSLRKALG